jgi:hypothetical protein
MGLQIQVFDASTSREIDAAFATLVNERPDALFVGAGAFWINQHIANSSREAESVSSRKNVVAMSSRLSPESFCTLA